MPQIVKNCSNFTADQKNMKACVVDGKGLICLPKARDTVP